jgi:hypothetical protein
MSIKALFDHKITLCTFVQKQSISLINFPLKSGELEFTQLFHFQISKWIKTADVPKLEHAAYMGKGAFMKGRSAWNEDTRKFLQTVPTIMATIGYGIHPIPGIHSRMFSIYFPLV